MIFFIRLFTILIIFYSSLMVTNANAVKYYHKSITIAEAKKKVNFTILTLKEIPDDWTLEIKTASWLMLHYMDSQDTKMIVGNHEERREVPLSDDEFPNAQHVEICENKGYFQGWANSGEINRDGKYITGGLLSLVQEGTFIEMTSSALSKENMIEMA